MDNDVEIEAMFIISKALSGLDDNARSRVLKWAVDRHGLAQARHPSSIEPNAIVVSESSPSIADMATLFHEAAPKTDAEKALIAGYWFQEVQGQKEWEAQPVNAELRNLGHRLSNITDALNSLMDRRPGCVMQVGKSGASRQARKRYRLTTAGISLARELVSRNSLGASDVVEAEYR